MEKIRDKRTQMNYFIIANNPKYNKHDYVQKKYRKQDKVIRINAIPKTCKEILKGKTDYHCLRKCKNNFSKRQLIKDRGTKTLGLVGYNLKQWSTQWSVDLNRYNPVIELNNIQKKITERKASTGFGVVYYFSNQYPNSTVYLVGFTFKGFAGHNWSAEKKWCCEKENIVII